MPRLSLNGVGPRVDPTAWVAADAVLVGMGAAVLNDARVGSGTLVAAGAVVLENTVVPPNSLVAGVPGKVRRETTEEERRRIAANAETYLGLVTRHAGAEETS